MKHTLQALVLLFFCAGLFAQGRIIIPEPPVKFEPGQVSLKNVNAVVDLKQGAGTVKLEQEFYNESPMRLEGEYLFAIPDNAQIYDFNLYIDGKKTKGKIYDKKKAAQIYENIVRSMRDPALLEYTGYGLFKARIFPIEAKKSRKIELSYAQILSYDDNTFRFTMPIRQSGQGSIEKFNLKINLRAESSLANIYSPTHKIEIERINDKYAKISLEKTNMEADKDFVLYYSIDDKEINGTLLSFRPRTDKDGFFVWMVSPKHDLKKFKAVPKDVIFVLDVSGSMEGEKIVQAKDALLFCMNALNKNDRFEVISFSSTINNFQQELKTAGTDELKNARYYIRNLDANGGTNINAALLRALKLKDKKDQRPTSIVFLTDGLPTEGEQNIGSILQNIKNEKKDYIRIFNFGVGYDVNTYLLDKLSKDSHGSANYVRQGENIETEVSKFFAKISAPVLTNTSIEFDGIAVNDVFPQELPDIFKGQRVTIFGRYRKPGKAEIILKGRQGNNDKKYTYKVDFKKREEDNEFIAKLWANRKVTHLLTQIRFNGENPELVQSIKSLAEEYGIVTPYTSYLVTEQKKEIAHIDGLLGRGAGGASAKRMMSKQRARAARAQVDDEDIASETFFQSLSASGQSASASSGKGAVMSSRALKKVAEAEQAEEMITTVKRIGMKTFMLKEGIWIEKSQEDKIDKAKKVEYLSDDYFKLSKQNKQIRKILTLGSKIVFSWDGRLYQITEKTK